MNTVSLKASQINRRWHLIDLDGQILGRTATKAAGLLIGKHKPEYTSHIDSGDYVVVINTDKLKVTGKKLAQKTYYRHSGYPGNLKAQTLEEKMAQDSTKVFQKAVKGMLPKNKLQAPRMARMKIFKEATHPYADKFNQK
ncbi:50S ribosomal protein L13 [Candidatus Collierbacteria bacterium RIFOXYB1_FULL_49_13]|uniref:Large ribosomal subunit protein uL13 n=1 Tax=Candidatus Collierbacteria bacterium RIFOXYB1_FULL_49_13 TaxID=1817728 RepID=A0A1F5FHP4_9BACT|nr:MAG: 50S ribosomal protein L13 [Candidatus Collierbacteria bacterium RIFOXYB1_FULL_49_13]